MAAPHITAITTYPNRASATNQANYSADADAFFASVDSFQTQANDQADYLDGLADQVTTDSASAANSASAAIGASNWVGDWEDGGVGVAGTSYSYDANFVYLLKVGLADILTSEPSTVNSDWQLINEPKIFSFVVSQYANGVASDVGYIVVGADVTDYKYMIWPVDGRVYSVGSVTGAITSAFDPDDGSDAGLSGALARVDASTISENLIKTDKMKVSFDLTGSVLTLNQDITVRGVHVASGSTVALPTLSDGADYKIFCLSDGTLSAQGWDTSAPDESLNIGGFHVYHTTGGINPNSIWDLRWRAGAKSQRGMTLSPDQRLWVDIYLADVDYGINGYSQAGATIADDSNPPVIPDYYGGNGVTTYGSLTWFEAWDLAINAGKRLPFWGEFTGFAYGVVEQQAVGTDPVITQHQTGYRSACGAEQVTGVLWQWGADSQGSGSGWSSITDGRGGVHSSSLNAVLLGAFWGAGSNAGSRSADWNYSPSFTNTIVGMRAVSDHVIF